MRVLMVAPRIGTPWTEGRKKWFLDLCQETIGRWDVVALITVDDGESSELPVVTEEYVTKSGWQHLASIRSNLAGAIRKHRPDLVCHFPFGVFSGLRGLANIWSISYVERYCKSIKIPCCTLMYSLTRGADNPFYRRVLKRAYLNQHGASNRTVRFGVKLQKVHPSHSSNETRLEKNILFMAGLAEENDERLDYALDVRGLRFLLRAGARLQERGYRLIIAIPLLRNKRLRERLVNEKDNRWVSNSIEFCEVLPFPDIYRRTHVFAFPYASEELQFVPTSIIEAMHFSVPVILPKLDFLAPFYEVGGRVLAYEKDDIDSFIAQLELLENSKYLNALRTKATAFVECEYNIQNSISDIEKLYRANSYRSNN